MHKYIKPLGNTPKVFGRHGYKKKPGRDPLSLFNTTNEDETMNARPNPISRLINWILNSEPTKATEDPQYQSSRQSIVDMWEHEKRKKLGLTVEQWEEHKRNKQLEREARIATIKQHVCIGKELAFAGTKFTVIRVDYDGDVEAVYLSKEGVVLTYCFDAELITALITPKAGEKKTRKPRSDKGVKVSAKPTSVPENAVGATQVDSEEL